MTYATLLVHVAPGQLNTRLLKFAGMLADRFNSGVIGVAACQPTLADYDSGYSSGDWAQADRDAIEKDLLDAEAEFRDAFQARATPSQWRSRVSYGPLAAYVAAEARSTDLIVTNLTGGTLFGGARRADTGDLIMQAGRPVLLVPDSAEAFKADRIVLGWKDTRETRRAAVDALPMLKTASHVALVEIATEDSLDAARGRLDEVAAWLKRHGVSAKTIVAHSKDDDALQLSAIAQEQGADILVAGAYGHNRLREWAFGGVTHDLLLRGNRCSLVSH